MDLLIKNVLVIAAEVAAIVVVFILLNWLARRIITSVIAAPALQKFEPAAMLAQRNLRLILVLICLLIVAGVVGANGYLMWNGEALAEYTLNLVRNIPRGFWIDLGVAAGKVAGILIITAVLLKYVRRALDLGCARAKAYEGLRANDESIQQFFTTLTKIVVRGSWLFVLAVSTRLLQFPSAVPDTLVIALKIYLIIATGILIWRALDALVDSAEALSKKYASGWDLLRVYERLKPLVPLLRRSIEYVIYVTVATLVVLQVEIIAPLAEWGPRLIRIIGAVFIGRVVIELVNFLLEETLLTRAKLTAQQKQRRETMIPLFRSILAYAIYFVVAIVVLKEVGIDPTPVLAGAGIIGLAVGLGAQNLINDVVSGFFILFEEHFLVGDFVKSGEAEGVVESIDLRTTRIRDGAGRHHILRNGQIAELVNYSKEYTNAVVHVGVAYESDLNHVYSVLRDLGQKLFESRDDVLKPSEVKGVEEFGESELLIRIATRVAPGRHLDVERALRKLIKEAFDAHGIEIPYARRVLIMPDADPEDLSTA
jgi:small conductance mechanosensitive channel